MEKLKEVVKSVLLRIVLSKIALFRSQLSKTAVVKSDSEKSISRSLQSVNRDCFKESLWKEEKSNWQPSKCIDSKNGLQSSKFIPSNLQSLNFTFWKDVFKVFAPLKSQLSNSLSINFTSEQFVLEKLQFTKIQFSYSSPSNFPIVKSIFLNSSSKKMASIFYAIIDSYSTISFVVLTLLPLWVLSKYIPLLKPCKLISLENLL